VSAAASKKGFVALELPVKIDFLIPCPPNEDSAVWGTSIDSSVFVPSPRSKTFSETGGPGSSRRSAAKKNGLRMLRPRLRRLVRSQDSARPRQALRRYADLPGGRDPAILLPVPWHREAKGVGIFSRKSVLHQSFRLLRQLVLSNVDDQGSRRETESRLEHGQDSRNPVYARAAAAAVSSTTESDQHRRDLAAPGAHLSGHYQRSVRQRPFWYGGQDRSKQNLDELFAWLGFKVSARIRLAVMDMWKAFSKSTRRRACPRPLSCTTRFHVLRHLGKAPDKIRKIEYARLVGRDRRFIKGQKYNLLSSGEDLTNSGRASVRLLMKASKHAELLKNANDKPKAVKHFFRCLVINWLNKEEF